MRTITHAFTLWACARSAIGTQSIGKGEPKILQDLAVLLSPRQPASAFAQSGHGVRALRKPIEQQIVNYRAPKVALQAPMGALPPMGSPAAPKPMMNKELRFDPSLMPGVSAPLGFFDPAGLCQGASEGKICFYREVELKHGRLSMMACLGYGIGERFHPGWGGNIDVASYKAWQETPLQTNWGPIVFIAFLQEIFSIFTFESPLKEPWAMRTDYESGNFGFDPLNLRPDDAENWQDIQTKEINNGRVAMFGIIGMIGQEMATGQKIFAPND